MNEAESLLANELHCQTDAEDRPNFYFMSLVSGEHLKEIGLRHFHRQSI